MQVLVRDNNVDQALKALKKKMQREGIFREMKLRGHYEKPSEKKAREKAEAIRRARKLARKKMQREGLLPMKPRVVPGAGGPGGPAAPVAAVAAAARRGSERQRRPDGLRILTSMLWRGPSNARAFAFCRRSEGKRMIPKVGTGFRIRSCAKDKREPSPHLPAD